MHADLLSPQMHRKIIERPNTFQQRRLDGRSKMETSLFTESIELTFYALNELFVQQFKVYLG